MTLRKPAATALLAAPLFIAACTFLVKFDDKDPDDDAGMIIGPAEASIVDVAQQPVEAGPDAPTKDPCAVQPNGFKWGQKTTDRCCDGASRSFDSYSDTANCGVCGFACTADQQCVRSLQGYFFCVGCYHEGATHNAECPITSCCSNDRTTSAVFNDPAHQNRGVCSASNCSAVCGNKCPAPSVCYPSSTTSFVCLYQ